MLYCTSTTPEFSDMAAVGYVKYHVSGAPAGQRWNRWKHKLLCANNKVGSDGSDGTPDLGGTAIFLCLFFLFEAAVVVMVVPLFTLKCCNSDYSKYIHTTYEFATSPARLDRLRQFKTVIGCVCVVVCTTKLDLVYCYCTYTSYRTYS